MDTMGLLRAVVALVFVLGLIAAAAWAARRFGPGFGLTPKPKAGRSLGVIESLQLDARHRLVLVRRDDRQHLLLIGPNHSTVVEGSIADGTLADSGAPP
jgi:flagellar protein FliO/FliZ